MPARRLALIFMLLAVPAFADNWPAWRGPDGNGQTSQTNLPLKWSPTDNVKWKTPLPDEGNSTPVIWRDRVFLTQASKKTDWPPKPPTGGPASAHLRSLMCFDRGSGKLLWQKDTIYEEKEPTHHTNPFCSASPVTDGERIIVSHGSAGMYCYDFAGKQLWRKDLGKMDHIWGNASSPILHGDMVILLGGPGKRQFLLAADKKTGSSVWENDIPGGKADSERPYIGSWCTPIVVRVRDHDELIVGLPERAKGFDPATGKELWSCDGIHNPSGDELMYTSPVYTDGVVVALGGFGGAGLAVRVGGSGDVTNTHRLWYQPRNPQRIGSPVIIGNNIYIIDEPGSVRCLDLKTGKELWKQDRATGATWGSLVAAGNRIYVTDNDGQTIVFAANPEKYEQLAKNSLGKETTKASIAVAEGELFIRTYKHLWCISEKK